MWPPHLHAVQVGPRIADHDKRILDAIDGTFYYQMVTRGSGLDDPETLRRCREAFEIIWRGMET